MKGTWIFAYGSLIHRPGFAWIERRRAFVEGWSRRFFQGSPDHRGTPEAPGRVVTLIRDAGAWCGGCAYRIDPASADAIVRELDAREQAGFEHHRLALHDGPRGAVFAEGLTYVAPPGNAHWLGPLDEHAIAAWVQDRHGPSGPNAEYVKKLHAALLELGIDDPHVDAITKRLA